MSKLKNRYKIRWASRCRMDKKTGEPVRKFATCTMPYPLTAKDRKKIAEIMGNDLSRPYYESEGFLNGLIVDLIRGRMPTHKTGIASADKGYVEIQFWDADKLALTVYAYEELPLPPANIDHGRPWYFTNLLVSKWVAEIDYMLGAYEANPGFKPVLILRADESDVEKLLRNRG